MALILCIETGTDICSVGIARDGELLSLRESEQFWKRKIHKVFLRFQNFRPEKNLSLPVLADLLRASLRQTPNKLRKFPKKCKKPIYFSAPFVYICLRTE